MNEEIKQAKRRRGRPPTTGSWRRHGIAQGKAVVVDLGKVTDLNMQGWLQAHAGLMLFKGYDPLQDALYMAVESAYRIRQGTPEGEPEPLEPRDPA
jgi:hypothetical protein